MRASASLRIVDDRHACARRDAALAQDAQQPAETTARSSPRTRRSRRKKARCLEMRWFSIPAALATPPKKPLHIPGSTDKGYDVKRTRKPDGSTTVVVKQPLPTEWTNSVGADLPPSNSAVSTDLIIHCRRRATVSARLRPGLQSACRTSEALMRVLIPQTNRERSAPPLKQSIPFGERFALTVQDTYSVTETVGRTVAGPGRYAADGSAAVRPR